MIIYKATNLLNNKVYIGLTINSFRQRKNRHIYDAFNSNSNLAFHRALRKYGEDSFEWQIIDNAKTVEELREKEIYWISHFSSFGENGYNMTIGGEGKSGHKMSDEAKLKLSEANKGKTLTDEHKKKLSAVRKRNGSQKGSNNPHSKLTEDDVLKIKELIKSGENITRIADKFNISQTAISAIKSGNTWAHIGEDISYIECSMVTNVKLTEDEVREIKVLLKEDKLKQKEIANKFNVGVSIINKIKTGKRWKHVEIA